MCFQNVASAELNGTGNVEHLEQKYLTKQYSETPKSATLLLSNFDSEKTLFCTSEEGLRTVSGTCISGLLLYFEASRRRSQQSADKSRHGLALDSAFHRFVFWRHHQQEKRSSNTFDYEADYIGAPRFTEAPNRSKWSPRNESAAIMIAFHIQLENRCTIEGLSKSRSSEVKLHLELAKYWRISFDLLLADEPHHDT
ncbi:predicted protein [Sclerotinia sclerotiorum 1980 UF-70]|uniref:Uncharacterized protein n=1 Tax=Sclerotinia sclerotiorum (strain ATCC 18683 / 1980 / Ss-1) TaxID=665079 RepID=A7EUU1_SCLS1|nr:predicted protein [Sclerotinia sclerotiorum 1980 UF-70]EDN93233.1 predicted protein [Sclerotinia sclerotiorum 1980 UF-70]